MAKLEFNRQLILWLFSVIPGGAAAVISLYEGFGRMYPDSPNYIKWMEFFAGSNPTFLGLLRTLSFRNATVIIAQRPVVPVLAALLSPLIGARPSFGTVNMLFWIAGTLASYYIGRKIVSDRFGVLCAAFYATSIPLFAYGAAVLTDSAGYFFVGVALCLNLQKASSILPRRRATVEGVLMGIGSFSNPSGLAALTYLGVMRCWIRRNLLPFLLGVAVLFVPVVLIAVALGWGVKLVEFASYVLHLRFAGIRSGPPFLDAFMWTFNLSAVGFFLGRWFPYAMQLLFLCATIAGVVYLPHKKEFLHYSPFLLVYEFVAHSTIERYLFVVWPVFIPLLLVGLGKVASVFTLGIDKLVRGRIRIDPLLFVAIYIDVQAWINLITLYPGTFNMLRL